MKRLLLMLLVVTMLFSLIGCGGSADVPAAQPTATASEETPSESLAPVDESNYDEPMTISLASVQLVAGVDYNEDDFSKFFQDKYNIQWDLISLSWDDWAEKMRIWINSNDMPDLATWNYVHGEAINYAEQGLVRRFPDDWKTTWPNVAKAYDDSQLGPAVEEIMGGTFFLPKPIFSTNTPCNPLVPHTSLMIRKDWFEAVGAEIKDAYKMSEINDIARKIKEQDPGNLGTKLLPINMRYGNASGSYITSNNEYAINNNQFYKDENNKYHWGPALPETLIGLKLYQKAFQEGLLNPEFFTIKGDEDKASFFASGQTGITVSEGMATFFQTFDQELKKNLNLNADEVMHVAYVIGEDGKYHSEEIMNFWTTSIFSPKMEDAKFERIMDMFDFVATQEGQLMVRLGFEDKDYSVESDGSYKILWEEGKQITDIYPSIHPLYGNMVILSDDFAIINPAFPKKYRDTTLNLYQSKVSYVDETSVPPRDWDAYFQDSPSRRKLSFELGKEYAQLITMSGDLETNWKKWVEDNKPLVDPVLEELNALVN